MAGEVRGELAEAIGKVAIEKSLRLMGRKDRVFWEDRPEDAVIDPDITVGAKKDNPKVVVLVNASGSPKESEKKYWRNLGEIFESKSRLTPSPAILNLVFKSEIKPELIKLTATLCDSTHLVDLNEDHGQAISTWIESHVASAPSKKDEKEQLVHSAIARRSPTFDSAFQAAVSSLAEYLAKLLPETKEELDSLWDLSRKDFQARLTKEPRTSRVTMLRRGLARWLVFDSAVRGEILSSHFEGTKTPLTKVPAYGKLLGMIKSTVAGGELCDGTIERGKESMLNTVGRDLRMAASFFLDAAMGDIVSAQEALSDSLQHVPDEMERAASIIRAMPLQIAEWHQFVLKNWGRLTEPEGCFKLMMKCSQDPTMGGEVSAAGSSVWIYDHLVSILREAAGRNNDFGYGALGSFFKANHRRSDFNSLMVVILGELKGRQLKSSERWLSKTLRNSSEPGRRGFQEWLDGRKSLSPVIIGSYSYSLSHLIRSGVDPAKIDMSELVARHGYSLWNKLLTHQDFEPLPQILGAACVHHVSRVEASTLMADMAERTVQNAGTMPAFAFKGGLICWQSVTNAGKDHKRKELSGRARALRFQRTRAGFRQRPNARKLYLVVDGTFNDTDLEVLKNAGWDGIFYPDEMDELAKLIGVQT